MREMFSAESIQRETSSLLRSSSATTASESSMKSRMIFVWPSRMPSVLLVSRRPG
jgi:hypothetical protein